jgi:hypothetical protein
MAHRFACAHLGSPRLNANALQEKKRSFFVVVGDRQKDVIVNLYHILLNVDVKLNKSVLWAYKNKLLGFSRCAKAQATVQNIADIVSLATARSAKKRSRTRSSEESATSTPKTPSSYSFRPRTFDMYTTRRRTRFWETRTACVYCRTLKPSHRISSHGQ